MTTFIYVAMNTHWQGYDFELPELPIGQKWYVFVDTRRESPEDIWEPGHEPVLTNQSSILVGDRAMVILVGR